MNTLENSGTLLFINNISISVIQAILIFSIIAIFILLKKYQMVVAAICFYCLYWAHISPQVILHHSFSDSEKSMFMFMFLAFSFAALGVVSVIQNDNTR